MPQTREESMAAIIPAGGRIEKLRLSLKSFIVSSITLSNLKFIFFPFLFKSTPHLNSEAKYVLPPAAVYIFGYGFLHYGQSRKKLFYMHGYELVVFYL